MMEPRTRSLPARRTGGGRVLFWLPLLLLLLLFGVASARAALQFDVFPGYDFAGAGGRAGFPLICEIKNDGPSFTGVIEISPGNFTESQTRREVVELPTGTLKRVVIPVFSSGRYQGSWDVKLLDDHGRVRSQQAGLQPKLRVAAGTLIMGSLPRSAAGLPVFPKILNRQSEQQPVSARLPSPLFPDNPLVLEGMDCIYLNSEKAADLKEGQVNALMAWLNNGGHLIVAVEQAADVNGVPWLRQLVPMDLTEIRTLGSHPDLQRWVRGQFSAADNLGMSAGDTLLLGRRPAGDRELRGASANPFNDFSGRRGV